MSIRFRSIAPLLVAPWILLADFTAGLGAADPALPEISPPAVMAHVRFLASEELKGRRAGTESERIAAAYIAARLEAAGAKPLPGKGFVAPFSGRSPFLGRGMPLVRSANVVGWIEGSDPALRDEVIVLGAHLDALGPLRNGLCRGADDNASGVAAALEVAAALGANRSALGRSVLFAFFGAEEMGLVGSFAFVRDLPIDRGRIVAMVNLDLLGRPLAEAKATAPLRALLGIDSRNSVAVIGAIDRPLFPEAVEAACKEAGIGVVGTRKVAVLSSVIDGAVRASSDHYNFEQAGIPTVWFGDGDAGGIHTAADVPERILPELLAKRARAVYGTVAAISRAPRDRLPPKKAPAAAYARRARRI